MQYLCTRKKIVAEERDLLITFQRRDQPEKERFLTFLSLSNVLNFSIGPSDFFLGWSYSVEISLMTFAFMESGTNNGGEIRDHKQTKNKNKRTDFSQ